MPMTNVIPAVVTFSQRRFEACGDNIKRLLQSVATRAVFTNERVCHSLAAVRDRLFDPSLAGMTLIDGMSRATTNCVKAVAPLNATLLESTPNGTPETRRRNPLTYSPTHRPLSSR